MVPASADLRWRPTDIIAIAGAAPKHDPQLPQFWGGVTRLDRREGVRLGLKRVVCQWNRPGEWNMPTYEYECQKCKQVFEKFQTMTAERLKFCPKCHGRVKRLLGTGAGIIFKGSGFYTTDYRSSSYSSGEKSDTPSVAKTDSADKAKTDSAEKTKTEGAEKAKTDGADKTKSGAAGKANHDSAGKTKSVSSGKD